MKNLTAGQHAIISLCLYSIEDANKDDFDLYDVGDRVVLSMDKKEIEDFKTFENEQEEQDMPNHHREYLEDRATEHIYKMAAKGFTSGELIATEPNDLIEYTGFWSLDTATI